MDVVSFFRNEVFRPLVIICVPGLYATAPFLVLFVCGFPAAAAFLTAHESVSVALAILTVIAGGMIVEDIGSRIECFIDNRNLKRDNRYMESWYAYLLKTYDNNQPWHHYMNTIVLRFKFELSMSSAAVLSIIGQILLNSCVSYIQWKYFVIIAVVQLAIAAYLLFEAKSSSELLHTMRKKITKR